MGNFFENNQAQNANANSAGNFEAVNSELRDIMSRIRQVEEKVIGLKKSLSVNEQNALKNAKNTNIELKAFDSDFVELKKGLRGMGEEIKLLVKDAKGAVKRDDFKLLEKYVSFWQPLNYVTFKEMRKEIRIMIREEFSKTKENNDDYRK